MARAVYSSVYKNSGAFFSVPSCITIISTIITTQSNLSSISSGILLNYVFMSQQSWALLNISKVVLN